MDNPIVYNKDGLLHGSVDTGPGGCVSEWEGGRLVSHYREIGLGWSIRVVKMWDSYYYSYKHIDYEKKQLCEVIYGYKYAASHNVKVGDSVFCAYKERATFRILEASQRMIANVTDNVLFPLKMICKKIIYRDVSGLLDADDIEGIHDMLDIQKPDVEIEEDYIFPPYFQKYDESPIEDVDVDVDVDSDED
jgi:hypothetical protein